MNPFDYINDITNNKKGIMIDDIAEKEYNSFIVNRGLGNFRDCILYANEMNVNHHLDARLQYDFFINSLKPRKRFAPWAKKETLEHLDLVKQYYGYNHNKALAALRILTNSDLEKIAKLLDTGGTR